MCGYDDNIVSRMFNNQSDYYPEYKLHEHHELPPPLETIGEKEKVRKQASIPCTISSPAKSTGLLSDLAI